MKIKPVGERVLLKPILEEEKTKGGIYIPESARENNKKGKVIEVGEDKEGKSLPLKKDMIVLYSGYSNEEIELEGEKYIIVDYKDIIAIIEE